MAEKSNGILDNLNRFGMTTLSVPYNISSEFLNSIPFLNLNTPYIDPNAGGLMQGGFVSKDEMDKIREDRIVENMGDEYAGMLTGNSGIAALTGMEGSPELPSQKPRLMAEPDIELKPRPTDEDKEAAKKRIEGDKEEAKEDDRPKTLKDYMAKILDDGDALIALGGAIARGEGLVGGLEEFSKTRKETEATEYAREVAKYERERQQELDTLEKASTLAEIAYKESQLTSDEQKIAQDLAIQKARAQGITDIESSEFAEIYADAIESVVNKEKPLTLSDINEGMALKALNIDTSGMNLNSGTPVPLFDASGKRIN